MSKDRSGSSSINQQYTTNDSMSKVVNDIPRYTFARQSFEEPPVKVAGNKSLNEYLNLPVIGKCKAAYIYFDGRAEHVIVDAKRTIDIYPQNISEVPDWPEQDSISMPVALYKDPFSGEHDILVLCERYRNHGKSPIYRTNRRIECKKIMVLDKTVAAEPFFEIEQQYVFEECIDPDNFSYINARQVVEAHYQACLDAGILINGARYSTSAGKCWSYTIGPCNGLKAADMLWVSRYILQRVSQDFRMTVHMKTLKDKHSQLYQPQAYFYFSTKVMRGEGGLDHMNAACQRLILGHEQDVYRFDVLVMNSRAEAVSQIVIPEFTTEENHKGFIMDTRPAAAVDPYDVVKNMAKRCIVTV